MKPDRVILGVGSAESAQALEELYAPFVRTGNPLIFMDLPSAEMTKYAANAMLATRISFMNQVARLCEAVGADVTLVSRPSTRGTCCPRTAPARECRSRW